MLLYYSVMGWLNWWVLILKDSEVKIYVKLKTNDVKVVFLKKTKTYTNVHPLVLNSMLEFSEEDSGNLLSFLDGYEEGLKNGQD